MKFSNDFIDALNTLIIPFKPSKTKKHKPSNLGTKCQRRAFYNYEGIETPDFNARLARIFGFGHAMEDSIIKMLKANPSKFGVLQDYTDPKTGLPPMMFGTPDPQFVVTSKELRIPLAKIDAVAEEAPGHLRIYEFKSINDKGFQELTEPKYDHMSQASIYYSLLRECNAAGAYDHLPTIKNATKLLGVRFVYINKNDCDIKAYDASPKELKAHYETIVKPLVLSINEHADARTLPPKADTTYECRFCPFAKQCKANYIPA